MSGFATATSRAVGFTAAGPAAMTKKALAEDGKP